MFPALRVRARGAFAALFRSCVSRPAGRRAPTTAIERRDRARRRARRGEKRPQFAYRRAEIVWWTSRSS
eukprot:5891219-Lingulodinium_polyedra.AAC.1